LTEVIVGTVAGAVFSIPTNEVFPSPRNLPVCSHLRSPPFGRARDPTLEFS
jgi:hypothetical protein